MRKIILIGSGGSGKSTLAREMGMPVPAYTFAVQVLAPYVNGRPRAEPNGAGELAA